MTDVTDTSLRNPDGAREARPAAPTTRTLRVAVVNGSPSEKSKTMGLADVALQTLRDVLAARGVTVAETRVDVYRLGPPFTGALERDGIASGVEAARASRE